MMGEILQTQLYILECQFMLLLVLSCMLLVWMLPKRGSTNINNYYYMNVRHADHVVAGMENSYTCINVRHADHVMAGMENSYTTSSSSSSQAPQNHAGREDTGPLQENDDEEQFTPE